MNNTVSFILSLSILFPIIAWIVRLNTIPKAYYPLIYMLAAGLIVELISFRSKNNAIATNLYVLAEFILFCWLFYNLKQVLSKRKWLYALMLPFILMWIFECILLRKLDSFDIYYRILYPFALVLLAVNQLNYLIINDRHEMILNPLFILCCAMIIYFSYKCLIEIFYMYAHDSVVGNAIFSIHIYINVLFNILLTLVVICLPKKRIITLR
ncbi:hypothetical protein I5907_14955 [Panacibacter sp. DH6]|uniref:Uncharacterized protein n=1 Tax=Panacibacter microcysteis TaxID=2793269 RepID=A0A931E8Y0_9BACT|nr:hypothetical protein [Panacibacter microcysteis]MBG9377541.1 hypothetical protein [Panacibacter microcysteis]